jgi:hypothetical protein
MASLGHQVRGVYRFLVTAKKSPELSRLSPGPRICRHTGTLCDSNTMIASGPPQVVSACNANRHSLLNRWLLRRQRLVHGLELNETERPAALVRLVLVGGEVVGPVLGVGVLCAVRDDPPDEARVRHDDDELLRPVEQPLPSDAGPAQQRLLRGVVQPRLGRVHGVQLRKVELRPLLGDDRDLGPYITWVGCGLL